MIPAAAATAHKTRKKNHTETDESLTQNRGLWELVCVHVSREEDI
jgi:hypothetical protein